VHGDPIQGVDPTGLLPAWLLPLLLGTHVSTFVGAKFLLGDARPTVFRWANQELRTTVNDLTGISLPSTLPHTRRPDLLEAKAATGTIYEIKRAPFTALISGLASAAAVANPQLRDYTNYLTSNVPTISWSRGRSFLGGIRVHSEFSSTYLPRGTVLVTFNDYVNFPGVLLYDFIPEDDGDEIKKVPDIEVGVVAGTVAYLIAQRLYVRLMLTGATTLAINAKKADHARFKMAASLSGAAIGIGVGSIGFGI
jgi:hypothetical protein